MDRYLRQLPAIHNEYYQTNLLAVIDHLPQQSQKSVPSQVKSNFSETKLPLDSKNLLPALEFRDVGIVQKHEFDGLGNDTCVNQYHIVKALLGKGSHSFVKLAKSEGNNYVKH